MRQIFSPGEFGNIWTLISTSFSDDIFPETKAIHMVKRELAAKIFLCHETEFV